jgi:hypothetical protein
MTGVMVAMPSSMFVCKPACQQLDILCIFSKALCGVCGTLGIVVQSTLAPEAH